MKTRKRHRMPSRKRKRRVKKHTRRTKKTTRRMRGGVAEETCPVCIEDYPVEDMVDSHPGELVRAHAHSVCKGCDARLRSQGFYDCPVCRAPRGTNPFEQNWNDRYIGARSSDQLGYLPEKAYPQYRQFGAIVREGPVAEISKPDGSKAPRRQTKIFWPCCTSCRAPLCNRATCGLAGSSTRTCYPCADPTNKNSTDHTGPAERCFASHQVHGLVGRDRSWQTIDDMLEPE